MTDTAAEGLARELLAIHQDSYGTSAATVRVHQCGDDVVVFLNDIELQRNEEFLIDKERADLVLSVRSGFQQSIEPVFAAAVERATGRTVTAFLSTTSLQSPAFCVEIFRLAPAATSDSTP